MSAFALASRDFVREQLRAPLTLVLLVAIPVFFVLIFASVLGEFSKELGGSLQARSATAISDDCAAAFLSGTLAFFMVSSSRSADRRLAAAAIFAFAAIYIGIGAGACSLVSEPLAGSLLVLGVFSIDAFSGPQMTR